MAPAGLPRESASYPACDSQRVSRVMLLSIAFVVVVLILVGDILSAILGR